MMSTLTRVNCCSALLIREAQIILALEATAACLLCGGEEAARAKLQPGAQDAFGQRSVCGVN